MLARAAHSLGKALIASCEAVSYAAQPVVSRLQPGASTSGRTAAGSWFDSIVPLFGPLNGGPDVQLVRTAYTYGFKRSKSMPGLKYWVPRTNGTRHRIDIDYKALGVYTGPPLPELSVNKPRSGGRNHHGHVTVRGRGGGYKHPVRVVDHVMYKGEETDGPVGVVERIEHDPHRSAFLALCKYDLGNGKVEFKYHLAPHDLRVGDTITSGAQGDPTVGNRRKLKDIPDNTQICNIEFSPGEGGRIARSAGSYATMKYKEARYAVIAMPSGELRRLPLDCAATIGTMSNPLNKMTNMGKAGIARQRGFRPKVRGTAKNPVDHPHGGKTRGGRPSCTPWGVYCKGKRTRKRNKASNKYIVMQRNGTPIEMFVQAKKWRARAELERKLKSGATLPPKGQGPPQVMLGPKPPAWGVVLPAKKAQA